MERIWTKIPSIGLLALTLTVAASHAQPPQCEFDLDRNFSVATARSFIARAEAIVTRAGGAPLSGSALSEARIAMHDAHANLEQVMNLGALKFSGYCITCSPTNYLQAANALVRVSRNVAGDPGNREYSGLVETMESNLQRLDYCGAFTEDLLRNGRLGAVTGRWSFGRAGRPRGCELELTTSPSGRGPRIDSCHPNESSYWLLGSELIFVHRDGSVTSILQRQTPDYWQGPYVTHPGVPLRGIDHYIERDASARVLGDGDSIGSGCDIAGSWSNSVGRLNTTWRFELISPGIYRATETGGCRATGNAYLNGRDLEVEWTCTSGYEGTYRWRLEPGCVTGDGKVYHGGRELAGQEIPSTIHKR
jgi:hypothetical protein